MQDEHPIAALAEALDVSRSGFFAHRRKSVGVRRQQDQKLAREIAPIDLSLIKRTRRSAGLMDV